MSITLADGAYVRVVNPSIEVEIVPPQTRVVVDDAPHVTVVFDETALLAHIDDPEPHTAYDDMADLLLIYENRKA